MKHLLKIFFFNVMLALFTTAATAQALTPIYGTLTQVDKKYKELPSKGQRTPSLPIAYTICEEEGLQIMSPSISAVDIIEFEICDIESDECVFSFTDETTFIETLFSMNGEVRIRLITYNYECISDIYL